MTASVVIVGGGLAAAAVASTLRHEGFDGTVVLAGDEARLPYERPPLSKEVLRAELDAKDTLLYPRRWYEDNAVDVWLGRRAVEVRPGDQAVEFDDGTLLRADAVVLATGGRPRTLDGLAGERVSYLRTIDDAERLAAQIDRGGLLVTVGLGFIGAEVTASARTAGMEVVALERLAVPLEHLLGKELGSVCADIHRDHGVQVHTREQVVSVVETTDSVVVRTSSGLVVEGDAVVVGVGMVPNTEVGEASGLVVDNGIVVDEYGRTSQSGVWAAGDVANHYHPLLHRHVRVEHYDNALRQGAAVARDILGRGQPYGEVHWFWSDQYGHGLHYAGHADEWDQVVVRGSLEDRRFSAFYLHGGLIEAAFGIERAKEVRAATDLIRRRVMPDVAQLADPSVDLRWLGDE